MMIVMMDNPPTVVELLQATEWSCINKLKIVNYFCMATTIGQIKLWGIIENMSYKLD